VLVVLLASMQVACSASLPSELEYAAPPASRKLPLRIAVLADPALRVEERGHIDVNPGLATTIVRSLGGRFESVSMVKDRLEVKDADLLVIPSLIAPWGKRWALKLDFVIASTNQLVSQLQHTITPTLTHSQSWENRNLVVGFASGFLLCVICPITIPLMYQSMVDAYAEDLANNIPTLVQGVYDQVAMDEKLAAFGAAAPRQ
jgi:hypothetical protein